jgi:hypothetical protein
MKYIIILLIIILSSCANKQEINDNQIKEAKENIDTMTYEGCQYIGFYTSYSHYVFTHKGNCNNPIHQYK